jgi:hypothetical protein
MVSLPKDPGAMDWGTGGRVCKFVICVVDQIITKEYISIPTFRPAFPPPLKGAGQGGGRVIELFY